MSEPTRSRRQKPRTGFTLIELMVVVAIIVVLIAILAPSLERAMGAAQAMKCLTQLGNTAKAFLTFSREHNGTLPGGLRFDETEEWKNSWMGFEIGYRGPEGTITYVNVPAGTDGNAVWVGGSAGVSQDEQPPGGTRYWRCMKVGTLVPYIGGFNMAPKLYRCPSVDIGTLHSGIGSNGLFDYTSVALFAGAKAALIPATTNVRSGPTWRWQSMPTPILIEEAPNSSLNGCCPDNIWGNVDRIGRNHSSGGQYVAIDASAHRLEFTGDGGAAVWDFKTSAPSGRPITLGGDYLDDGPFTSPGYQFGLWNGL